VKKGAASRAGHTIPPPIEEPPSEEAAIKDIDRILGRLDAEIPKARKEMDELLARLRTTRILNAA
jgi:hypothetical protein